MAVLNNNQINDVLNDLYEQFTGQSPVDTIDLSTFVDTGNDANLGLSVEQFTKSLIVTLAKNWFTDTSYRSSYVDPYFVDFREYGGIVQMISCTVPEVQQSHAWKTFETGTTVGTYELFLPIIDTQYYGKTVSWELPICITYEQWDDALKSRDELTNLISYVLMCVDNAITQHLEDCNSMNRNNFMGEKIAYSKSDEAVGTHVVNLVKAYTDFAGITTGMTVEEFMNSKDALNFSASQLKLYKDRMKKQTTLFNTAEKVRFTPEERIVVECLSDYAVAMDRVARSDTFHNEFVEMPTFYAIPWWSGCNDLSFDEVSKIDIKTSTGANVEQSGIVAFMCDKWGIIHTLRKERVAVKDFEPEAIKQYYYQFRDSYMNNLTMNAIVFIVEDVSAETISA